VHPVLGDPHAAPHHPARYLRRQRQGAAGPALLAPAARRGLHARAGGAGSASGYRRGDVHAYACDHIGWNTRLENGRWVPTSEARYLFSAREYAHWEAENAKAAVGPSSIRCCGGRGRARRDGGRRPCPRGCGAAGGDAGAHAASLALRVGHGAEETLFTGDLIHSPLQARYPEMSMRADFDPALAAKTRRRVLECACEARTRLCFAHFPSPSTARLARWGDGFRAEAVG